MTDQPDLRPEEQDRHVPESSAKPYSAPTLRVYGDLRRMTRGSGGNKGDGNLPSSRFG